MKKLFLQIITGVLALWLATKFIRGVEFKGPIQILLLAGAILGLLNFFIKPILKIVTLPLRILTFGLSGLVINVGMIWAVDLIFPEFHFSGIYSIFLTTIIVWGLSLILPIFLPLK